MIEIQGKILFDLPNLSNKHNLQSDWKRTVFIVTDCDMYKYYSWFITKRFNLQLKKNIRDISHISFINDRIDTPDLIDKYEKAKLKYNNTNITFSYNPSNIRTNDKHWWLNIECKDIENIRSECGLTSKPYFGLHMTLGNIIDTQVAHEHSEYIHRQILRFNI